MNAEMDVMVDTPMPPGNTGVNPESSLEIYITSLTNGANLTPCPLVTTTSTEPSNLVDPSKEPPDALTNAKNHTKNCTRLTRPTELNLTPSNPEKTTSRLNCSNTDPSKLPSPFMEISLPINLESITMSQEKLLEDTPSKSPDGELKTEPPIGLLLTHGTKIGEMPVISESEEEPTNVESKILSLLDYPNSE